MTAGRTLALAGLIVLLFGGFVAVNLLSLSQPRRAPVIPLGFPPVETHSIDESRGPHTAAQAAFDAGQFARAYRIWRPLAEGADPFAQHYLAWMALNGLGTEHDPEQAMTWAARAAEQGYAQAQALLGTLYQKGVGAAEQPHEAFKWMQRAAGQNLPAALVQLGTYYETGYGVAQDLSIARKQYRRAAQLGHAEGAYRYGVFLRDGLGGPADPETAERWLKRAADAGTAAPSD
jgi:TPR repeat protein